VYAVAALLRDAQKRCDFVWDDDTVRIACDKEFLTQR